jgi:hypothetical protein
MRMLLTPSKSFSKKVRKYLGKEFDKPAKLSTFPAVAFDVVGDLR